MRVCKGISLAVLLFASLAGAFQLSGELVDAGGAPLPGVTVSLLATGITTTSGADGAWNLSGTTAVAPRGSRAVRAQARLWRDGERLRVSLSGSDALGRIDAATSGREKNGVAFRATAANVDTLVFLRNVRRLAAFPVQLDSVYRLPMRLDTASVAAPVRLRAVGYTWGRMPALAIILMSGDSGKGGGAAPLDSLSIRVFLRSRDTLAGTHQKLTDQGLLSLPLRFAEAMGVRYDICQSYDSAGFNEPCGQAGGGWYWGDLNRGVQLLSPERVDGSFDPATGTWLYAFDMPMGPTALRSRGRIRFDMMFSERSEYSKVLNLSQSLILDTLVRPMLPGRILPVAGDTGWFDAMDTPPDHAFGFGDSAWASLDWSFRVRGPRAGNPVVYEGMPQVASQSDANKVVDLPFIGTGELPREAPYICVYRKGRLLWGYPPIPGWDAARP